MECEVKDPCEIRSDFIQQEIENSFQYSIEQKKLSLSAIKLYIMLLSGLLGYAAFVQAKVISFPSDGFLLFSIFGFIFTLIVFLVGWALLSYLSHITAGVTKAYKHISSMRCLKSKVFENNEFSEHSIMPISAAAVPVRYSSHLPIIFSIINGSSLLMMLYFLELRMELFWAFFTTTLVLSIFGIYYPTACTNFYKHLKVAEKMVPGKSEIKLTAAVERLLHRQKKRKPYRVQKRAVILFMITFLILKAVHTAFYLREKNVSYALLLLESNALLMMFMYRYLLEAYKMAEQRGRV